MEETLNFLTVIDHRMKKKNLTLNKQHLSLRENRVHFKKHNRYPYAHALGFNEAQYTEYPKWLTEKHGFTEFMYKNYQQKLMSIPKICEKENKASDQKYLLSVYLSQVQVFNKLPQIITEIILNNLRTRYYSAGEVIHQASHVPEFMAVIYLGSVQFKSSKRTVLKQKHDAILTQAFYNKIHEEMMAKEETILLCLDKSVYATIKLQLRQTIQTLDRDQIGELMRSKFFSQLHLKDKKAQNFYNELEIQFYFNGQTIVEAGSDILNFYLLLKGEIVQQNHVYIRQHNKWPLANRKWQIRAVYNSYNKNNVIKKYGFFGDQQIVENAKFKAKYVTSSSVILFTMTAQVFLKHINSEDMKKLKKFRAENVDLDYNQFQNSIREKVKVKTQRKNIVLKAINTSLSNKSQLSPNLSPKKMALIQNFERSMLRKALLKEGAIE